jgi:opine dehydrogenase
MSLVPIASMGDMLDVPCPTIKAIIHLANLVHRCNYWESGRTVEKLGMAGLSLQQIRQLVQEGKLPSERRQPIRRRGGRRGAADQTQ